MTVYLVIILPKIPYIHRIYMVLANPACFLYSAKHQGDTCTILQHKPGLSSSIFWEQGFDEVCESSRTLKLFVQFDEQFWKWRILLVSMVILVQNMLCIVLLVYNIL